MHHQPFCTYEFQDLAIKFLIEGIVQGDDRLIEKARDMGVSWIVIGIFVWLWLNPKGGADFLLGSRIEDYVDERGNMRTLFEKVRYLLKRLPKWIMPRGFDWRKHDNFARLVNPESGSSLTGESNNPYFSTGGRYAAVMFDEFAKWKDTDEAAWTSAGDATPCRIPVSTAWGARGQFHALVTGGKIKKLRLDWWKHPLKRCGLYCEWPKDKVVGLKFRSPWYDREEARRSPSEMAQEINIDYLGAGNPVFEGKAGRRVLELMKAEKKPEGLFRYDWEKGRLEQLLVEPISLEDVIVLWFVPMEGDNVVLGVDVAEGKEDGDYSVVKGYSTRLKSLMISMFGRIDEVGLAKVLKALSKWLQKRTKVAPFVAIETIGPGLSTFDLCAENGTDNLWMMPKYDVAREAPSFTKGWRTSTSSKNVLVSAIREWLLDGEGWVDPRCCKEMTTFVRNKSGKAEAAPSAHDDEVIAWGIALAVARGYVEETLEPVVERRSDGLPVDFHKPRLSTTPEPTLEERCFQDALGKRAVRTLDPIDQLVIGTLSYGGGW